MATGRARSGGTGSTGEAHLHVRRLPSGTIKTEVGLSQFYSKVGIVPIYDSPDHEPVGQRASLTASIRMRNLAKAHNFESSRFPKLEECAHFHYDFVELGSIQICVCEPNEDSAKYSPNSSQTQTVFNLKVSSNNKTWTIKRSYENFRFLDKQLHKCIYDRKVSELPELKKFKDSNSEDSTVTKARIMKYVDRFSLIAGDRLNCGPVLNWLEMDNRGNKLLVPDDCDINTPAIAAAHVIKRYTSQATDEISLEVGDIISVIDMAPPEDTIWWRGKNKNFEVGYFPAASVEVIGDRLPSSMESDTESSPKPVLRKRGKLITFLRTFFNHRPTISSLKQSGIMRERVFGCDLGEHLLNSEHEVPLVLSMCASNIEERGLADGIYRLSGVASNIQKLRVSFDEDNPPDLTNDEFIHDIHSITSLLKMYFRELPNPLLTYQLYESFAEAVRYDHTKVKKIHSVVRQLPPPHYRTAKYLMTHLSTVAAQGETTGMHCKNLAIVWAPNLMRSKDLEQGGGTAVLRGVGIQAVVTECLIKYADVIFSDKMPNIGSLDDAESGAPIPKAPIPKKKRPKSLAVSTPTRLMSLEEANRMRAQSANPITSPLQHKFIEVGAGPGNLPRYHAVLDLPSNRRKKKSPSGGWKSFFGKNSKQKHRKISIPNPLRIADMGAIEHVTTRRRHLRSVRSADSLLTNRHSTHLDNITIINPYTDDLESHIHSRSVDDTALRSPTSSQGLVEARKRSNSLESYFEHDFDDDETPTPTADVSFFSDDTDVESQTRSVKERLKSSSRSENMLMETSFVGPDSCPESDRSSSRQSDRSSSGLVIRDLPSPKPRRKKTSPKSLEKIQKTRRLSKEEPVPCQSAIEQRAKVSHPGNSAPYVDTNQPGSATIDIVPVALAGSPSAKKKAVRKFSAYDSAGSDTETEEIFPDNVSVDLVEDCFRELRSRSDTEADIVKHSGSNIVEIQGITEGTTTDSVTRRKKKKVPTATLR